MSIKLQNIDDAASCKEPTYYKGDKDCRQWVISRPIEAKGILKWKVRIYKSYKVLTGEANALTYSKIYNTK